jgi:hypothetical protein
VTVRPGSAGPDSGRRVKNARKHHRGCPGVRRGRFAYGRPLGVISPLGLFDASEWICARRHRHVSRTSRNGSMSDSPSAVAASSSPTREPPVIGRLPTGLERSMFSPGSRPERIMVWAGLASGGRSFGRSTVCSVGRSNVSSLPLRRSAAATSKGRPCCGTSSYSTSGWPYSNGIPPGSDAGCLPALLPRRRRPPRLHLLILRAETS